MQTFSIHYPQNGRGKMKVIEKPSVGHFPVALIPGQFTDHYRTYSANQLKYMPLNTALKSAPKNPKAFHMAFATAKVNELKRKKQMKAGFNKRPRSDGSSSESSSSDSSSSDDDSSSSDSDSSSDESDVNVLEDEKPPAKVEKPIKALINDPASKVDDHLSWWEIGKRGIGNREVYRGKTGSGRVGKSRKKLSIF